MPAEQEFPEHGHDLPEQNPPGGVDPLMAVIGGEPLPPAARADAGLVAAHRAAAADVALLREQLGLLGDALADAAVDGEATPVRSSAPARARRRRPFAVALGGLAVACAAALLSGTAWLLTQSGSAGGAGADDAAAGSQEAGGVLFGSPRHLACARLVAEGTVTGTEPVPGTDRTRITLHVTRAYKPRVAAKDVDPVVFLVRDGVLGPLHEGDHTLIGLPRQGDYPDALFTDEEEIATERAAILRFLPASRGLTCPRG
ncbi:hypothetical protein ABZ354_05395 [Streptomyces sp. NPDC005925]|uniref:hypothetical protein n=1 Tax=Streptomyces sp. NPDC005925 TaxID=3157172 RepID=UPI0033E549E8